MGKRGFSLTVLIFLGSIGLFGLFYEYAGCIAGAMSGFLFCAIASSGKKLRFYVNADSILFCLWILSYGTVSFYAIDRGMAFLGFLKMLSVLFFAGLVMQMEEGQRQFLRKLIPLSGCLMVVLGLAGHIIPPLYVFFFRSGRLGGFFQYANVFALFCLLGIIIGAEEENHYRYYVQTGLLVLGIGLSGSRTVFLLSVAVFVLLGAKEKRRRLPFLAAAALLTGGMGIYVILSGDVENVGRIYSSFVSSSALRRILYLKDGLRLAAGHPFGLGYLGYYFIQSSVQTGVYSARFVHSDLLQAALDVGILPCLFLTAVFVRSILSKRQSFYEKLLIGALGLHCTVDFDLEFTVILFVLALFLDFRHGKEVCVSKKSSRILCGTCSLCIGAAMLYCGISMAFYTLMKDPGTAIRMLPIYSEAQIAVLQNEEDMAAARELAEVLAERDPYIPAAHDILALAAYEEGDYLTMAREKEKSVDLQKYNRKAYNRYVMLLSRGIEEAYAQGDSETLWELFIHVSKVPEKIEKVQKGTDPLAYRIRKRPKLKLRKDVEEYIDSILEILS